MDKQLKQLVLISICGVALGIASAQRGTGASALSPRRTPTAPVTAELASQQAAAVATAAVEKQIQPAETRQRSDWLTGHMRELAAEQDAGPDVRDDEPASIDDLLLQLQVKAESRQLKSAGVDRLLDQLSQRLASPEDLRKIATELARKDLSHPLRARYLEAVARAGTADAQQLLRQHLTRPGPEADRRLAITAAALVERPLPALFDALLLQAQDGGELALFSVSALGSRIDKSRREQVRQLIQLRAQNPKTKRAAKTALALLLSGSRVTTSTGG